MGIAIGVQDAAFSNDSNVYLPLSRTALLTERGISLATEVEK